ncbi:MAG: amidohydrolase [Tissierellia bacterium]|nr:amidohydrolase [Tissierellia bacterium]
MKTLIKNVLLLPMTSEEDLLEKGDILIEDNRISKVGKFYLDCELDLIIDGEGMLAMPGLINSHTHLGMSLMRNYADDLSLMDWLENKIWPLESYLEAEDVYWGALLNMMELIKTGTTSFVDMYFYMDEVAKAAEKLGMRGVITRGLVAFSDPEEKSIEETRALFKRWNGKAGDKLRVMVAPHAPYTCPRPYMEKVLKLADELNCPIHIHLSETEDEVKKSVEEVGLTPIEYMANMGLLNHHVVAAHCVHITDREIDLVKGKSFYPINNPTSNLKLASGFAPVSKMLSQGINVALGTDGASSNNHTNMWEEVHLASILNKAVDKDPTSVRAYEALKMATVNGAKAMNQIDDLGTLEVGKKADIILIDIDVLHMRPHHRLISSLAYCAQGSDVNTVIIDGEIVLRNHQFVNVDEREVIDNVEKRTRKLLERAGLEYREGVISE